MGGLKLFDLVVMNFVAVITLRWTATAASLGPVSMGLWVIAALMFFIPEALAVAALGTRFQMGEGGIFRWTEECLGKFHGFFCGWSYWLNNLLFFPTLLLFISTNLIFSLEGFGVRFIEPKWAIATLTVGLLWLIAILSIYGIEMGKRVQRVAVIGQWVPLLVILGFSGFILYSGRAPSFKLQDVTPKASDLFFLSQLCFAFSGLELVAFYKTKEKRTLILGIILSCFLIALAYMLGTAGILTSFSREKVTALNGVLLPLQEIAREVGLAYLPIVGALLIALGGFGTTLVWYSGSSLLPSLVLGRNFPALNRLHPQYRTPVVSIVVQTVLATLLTFFALQGGTRLEMAYRILVDMCLVLYFIPYCYLFACFYILKGSKLLRSAHRKVWAVVGFGTTSFAIGATLSSLDGVGALRTVVGTGIVLAIGLIAYFWPSQLIDARE